MVDSPDTYHLGTTGALNSTGAGFAVTSEDSVSSPVSFEREEAGRIVGGILGRPAHLTPAHAELVAACPGPRRSRAEAGQPSGRLRRQ